MPLKRKPDPENRTGKEWKILSTVFILLFSIGCVSVAEESGPEGTTGESEGSGGTSSPGADPDPAAPRGDAIGSSMTTSTALGSDLSIDIYELERLENNFLRLQIGVTNESPDQFELGYMLAKTEDRRSASSISLIDSANSKRYMSYNQTSGGCFCNVLQGAIPSGETGFLWVLYPEPPSDLNEMTITTPITPPIPGIPISSSSDSIDTSNNLQEPQVLDLFMFSDSLDGNQTGRSESEETVSIILSSDVLFETNSSNLSSEAQGILEQVAQEIDDASSSSVSIDGHADNTGNDSINVPLSKERAESVESTLGEIITREGVTFTTNGHGSAEPIANNATEEGRERNRRVSVTFEK